MTSAVFRAAITYRTVNSCALYCACVRQSLAGTTSWRVSAKHVFKISFVSCFASLCPGSSSQFSDGV